MTVEKMDLLNVCVVGGNAVSAFLSWRLQATNACDVTLVWKSGFDAVSQYGISFKYVPPRMRSTVFLVANCVTDRHLLVMKGSSLAMVCLHNYFFSLNFLLTMVSISCASS